MNTVDVTMKVPKEGKEIVDFVADLVSDIIAKKNVAEIVAENLPSLITAVNGYEDLGEELKGSGRDELAGYLVQRVFSVLDESLSD